MGNWDKQAQPPLQRDRKRRCGDTLPTFLLVLVELWNAKAGEERQGCCAEKEMAQDDKQL